MAKNGKRMNVKDCMIVEKNSKLNSREYFMQKKLLPHTPHNDNDYEVWVLMNKETGDTVSIDIICDWV